MANSDKKGGKDVDKTAAATGPATDAGKADNLFARHGNQQITEVIAAAQAGQKGQEAPMLAAAMESEKQSGPEASWWQDEEVTKGNAKDTKEEEEANILAANRQDDDAKRKDEKQQADKDAKRGRKLSPQEEFALLNEKKAQMSAGALAEQEVNIIKDAEAAGMDEEQQAAMLVKQGDVSAEVRDQQTGAVQSLLAAEQMPTVLADFNRDASHDVSKTPLNERDTIRNVTEEIRLIGKNIQTHPKLADPKLSVEEKATALVDILAYELDVPTRESVAAHPFVGLHEDLVFDPQSILAINSIAGSSREVRTLGSFAVVAWQLAVDTVKDKLAAHDDGDVIEEDVLWKNCLGELAGNMYVDALLKPSA
ncbi:MAG: hypothetical protein R3F61_12325 [Myxococcota bacterium]